MKPDALILSLLFFSLSTAATAQTLPAGPQVLTFFSDIDDTEQPYGLYLPRNFDPERRYPLVIMLHGAGSNHRLALRRVFGKSNSDGENDVEASRYFPDWPGVDYIVASPLARGTMGYQGIAEKDVLDVLADVKRRFPVDDDRVYLTGLSMGGGGTLWLGLTRPDLWAAIAPVCAAPPAGASDLAANALNLPAHFFHGDADVVVPVAWTRDWVKRFQDMGYRVEYAEYPGVNHNSWENAYQNGYIFDWFGQFRRNPFPDRVSFRTAQYKHDRAYWVRFDALTPGTMAAIDARFTGTNQLEITTSELQGFTLRLAGHPRFRAGRPLELTVDGQKLSERLGADSLSLAHRDGQWTPAATASREGLLKGPGAEGPISEAFAGRHVYVYGTGGNPGPDELRARRAVADKAAALAEIRDFNGRNLMIFPRVMADRDVRPSDLEGANLILFGTRETNSLIARFADRLPMHLASRASEYGLVYIFPLDGHYVVVNSGYAWWNDFQTPGLAGLFPVQLSSLANLKDFMLFRGSQRSVVAEGRFDNNWKLPEEAAAKLAETRVIELNNGARSGSR